MNKLERVDGASRPVILIVDDERSTQEAMASLLSADYRVKVAGNGLRALEIASSNPRPDLILLDVNMPEMDGYAVCRRLKENALTSEIPVIFLTAADDKDSEALGLQLGAVDYIAKPASPAITLLRVRNQILFRESLDKLRLTSIVFENTLECITITDVQGNIIDVNPAFSRTTGYMREEVLGKNPRFLKSGHHDQAFYEAMWQSIHTTGSWHGELWNRTKQGEFYPELRSISAVTDAQGAVTHYIGISSDISLLKQHEQCLEHIAHYDALTGIPNRVLLADRMSQGIAQARREAKMLGVCYLDLDGFKPINDSMGHQTGDHVLVEIARRLAEALREEDTVARLGGDEFVILLLGLSRVEECISVLKRIQASIVQPVCIQDHSFLLTASIGISFYPQDAHGADVLLCHADQAMYVAKQSGKNRFNFYDPAWQQ